jgi:hypothetical protein
MLERTSPSRPHCPLPEFGASVLDQPEPCTPRELFCGLFSDPEAHVHLQKPAFAFLQSVFLRAEPIDLPALQPEAYLDQLVRWARATLDPVPLARAVSSWPVRVVRELGPVGLSDGVWLRGMLDVAPDPSELRQCLLQQLVLRSGGPERDEAYAQRYSALLQSVGVAPGVIARWDFAEMMPCAELSYERALLGLCLCHFPRAFELEALGFNLWMAAVGPAPILEHLRDVLQGRRACLRYLDLHERSALAALAVRATLQRWDDGGDARARERITAGFSAAHRAYLRWEQAMLGPNVPFTPWDSVLEMVQRKARFAADHHRDVRLGGKNVAELLQDGGAAHEWLVQQLAVSPLIRPEDPDRSRFMTHSLSIDGPMFDAFTAAEKQDLREWIACIGTRDEARTAMPVVPLAGHYAAAQDPGSLSDFARERYGALARPELLACLSKVEQRPAAQLAAKSYVDGLLARLHRAFDEDPKLDAMPPSYSDRSVAELLAARQTAGAHPEGGAPSAVDRGQTGLWGEPPISLAGWLRGVADPREAEFEDCRWLSRIYAAEAGARLAPGAGGGMRSVARGEGVAVDLVSRAVSLNTRHFLPELLGLTLAVAALGLMSSRPHGRADLSSHAATELGGLPPDTLASWSLAAVQAFMRRVKDGSPAAVAPMWKRIWRVWRCHHLLACGSDVERRALAAQFHDLA